MKTVPLHGKKAAGRVALVDDEDYDLVMQYRWHLWEEVHDGRVSGPYALAGDNDAEHYTLMRMHCLIMGLKGVDHVDRNGLNNQRFNLRPASLNEQAWNTGPRRGSSRFKGVSWYKPYGTWRAYIMAHRQRHHLGYFLDEEDAARARDVAARKFHGEFAYLNFPDDLLP
jgi:hypothetical protein